MAALPFSSKSHGPLVPILDIAHQAVTRSVRRRVCRNGVRQKTDFNPPNDDVGKNQVNKYTGFPLEKHENYVGKRVSCASND